MRERDGNSEPGGSKFQFWIFEVEIKRDCLNLNRQREDEDGIRGILLQRNVVPTAALALKTNIASLAPLVLPFTELVRAQPPALVLWEFIIALVLHLAGAGPFQP